jgi:hypothetical protein
MSLLVVLYGRVVWFGHTSHPFNGVGHLLFLYHNNYLKRRSGETRSLDMYLVWDNHTPAFSSITAKYTNHRVSKCCLTQCSKPFWRPIKFRMEREQKHTQYLSWVYSLVFIREIERERGDWGAWPTLLAGAYNVRYVLKLGWLGHCYCVHFSKQDW